MIDDTYKERKKKERKKERKKGRKDGRNIKGRKEHKNKETKIRKTMTKQ